MDWFALIPMRERSKSIEKKNLKKIFGKQMYEYTIEVALKAGASKIFISTDIKQVLEKYKFNEKIVAIERKRNLTKDNTKMSEVVYDFLKNSNQLNPSKNNLIALLQPTSPLRRKEDIEYALKYFINSNENLLMSVTKANSKILKYGFVINNTFRSISKKEYCFQNRQELPKVFRPNGAIYIFKSNWFIKNKDFKTNSILTYEMKKKFSYDVDSEKDLRKIKKQLKRVKIIENR